MTRDEAKVLAESPIVRAFADGKTIQLPSDVIHLKPRIKPEPREVYIIWNGAWPNNSVSHFHTKKEAETWKNQLPLHREYKKFREVIE